MEAFYNKTVTIFNASSDNLLGAETWIATVLTNCRVLETKGANVVQAGIDSADSCKLFIKDVYLNKSYLPPIQYAESNNKSNYFTLKGDKDFFVIGDIGNVQATGDLFAYCKKHYDSTYRITTVDRYELMPHFEVGGK